MNKLALFVFNLLAIGLTMHIDNIVDVGPHQPGPNLHIKKIECPYSDVYMKDVICTIRPEKYNLGRFHFAGTLLKIMHHLSFEFTAYHRNEQNEFVYSNAAFIDDICMLAENGSGSLMFALIPGLQEKVKHMIQHCPYLPGRYEVPEFVQANLQHADLSLPMYATGDYKFVFTMRNEKNETLVEMSVEFCFD